MNTEQDYRLLFCSFLDKIEIKHGGYVDGMWNTLKGFGVTMIQGGDEQWWGGMIDYYEKTVIPHKVAVFNEGMKIKKAFKVPDLVVKNILIYHDISKFSVHEMAYAEVDFSNFKSNPEHVLEAFNLAWYHHKKVNPHHPEYHFDVGKDGTAEPVEMLRINIAEMIADWMGAGITYGNTLNDWLPDNLHRFKFHKNTAIQLMNMLARFLNIETTFADDSHQFIKTRSI